METTTIPHLKAKVSRIGLGTWAMGGWMWGGSDSQDSIDSIHRALDLGINLIDTAPVYGFGLSEEIVGKALKIYGKRENIVLVTKTGIGWKKERIYRDGRRSSLHKEVDESLKRLQTDYIDLYLIHWPDPLVSMEEMAETLLSLKDKKKVRAIGVSNFTLEQMKEFQKYAKLDANEPPYNLFERGIENKELPYCLEQNIFLLGYGSLCRGLLSGKMHQKMRFTGDDLRQVDPKFQEPRFSQYLECARRLEEWARQKHNKSLLALAVRWVLDKGVSCALWGARNPEQLGGIEEVWGWGLTQKDFAEIDQIISQTITMPVGPEFMAPPTR